MSPHSIARLIGVAILIFAAVIMTSSGTSVVHPGYRGVEVTMGRVSPAFKPEGFGLKTPFVEQAARELRYFWWLILLVALALRLIWGLGRKPKE